MANSTIFTKDYANKRVQVYDEWFPVDHKKYTDSVVNYMVIYVWQVIMHRGFAQKPSPVYSDEDRLKGVRERDKAFRDGLVRIPGENKNAAKQDAVTDRIATGECTQAEKDMYAKLGYNV